jgi:endonuclease YncB( thermonuclease family)
MIKYSLFFFSLIFVALAHAASLSGEVTRYTDGDTLRIWDQKIRLLGVDAPEFSQSCKDGSGEEYSCGMNSLRYLKTIIGSREVRCEGDKTDRYGRLLATCYVGEININKKLVEDGWAVAFVRYDDLYLPQEQDAKKHKRGIWRGAFQRPSEYRSKSWKAAKTSTENVAGEGCVIKGNINNKGEKIYHTPWSSKNYQRTRINTSKGEQWFCNEAEALAAGWRSPLR